MPGLGAVTPPLAGIDGSSRLAFLAYDSLGSLLWSGLYVVLGYLFASRLAVIAAFIASFGDVLVAAVGIPLALYIAGRCVGDGADAAPYACKGSRLHLNVWVLAGGLAAWKKEGFPVKRAPEYLK